MLSGPAALRNIDQTLQSVRNQVVRLDAELASLTDSVTSNQRRKVKIINDIAAVRLMEIESGTLHAELDSADQQAAQILTQRQTALDALNVEIETLNKRLQRAESDRETSLLALNEISRNIADTEAEVQAELKVSDEYLAQLQLSRDTESVAEEAAQKVDSAQTDMAEKALPYQGDKLFSYLWSRGFGTTDYQGGLVARLLDSWVARLIEYEPARINYWNLTEIPKRLQQHADAVAAQADDELMALQQLELDALQAAGIPELKQRLAESREQVDQQDDQLEELESELNAALERRAVFIAGDDEFIQRCLKVLRDALDHRDLRAVQRYVQVTHSPTDDELVVELQLVDDQLQDVQGDLADLRRLHANQLARFKEIEEVRRNFKNSRFDDVRSGFGNESLLAGILAQFVQGVVSGSDVWRTLKRHQRYRDIGSMPDFGSGGFGNIGDILTSGGVGGAGRRNRRQRNSSWHWPKPRRGGGGFNIPGGGGSSGGGFKTGGGF